MVEISYVIPTLNSALTLQMTLLSLRSQQSVQVEIVVVDSGSTDGTLEICDHWGIKTLYAEPGNMYRAINIGLRSCQSEWLGYINSDDWLYSDSLKRLIAFGNAHNSDIVYGKCDYTDGSGRFLYSMAPAKPEQLLSLFRRKLFGFAQQSAIFRRKVFQQLGGFNETYYLSADADFYLRALLAGYRFSYMPGNPVACFRRHSNQLSKTKAQDMQREKEKRLALTGEANLQDLVTVTRWRFTNLPHYIIRFLRPSLLADRVKFVRSASVGNET